MMSAVKVKLNDFSYNVFTMKKTEPLAFRIPDELKKGLQQVAAQEARSMSQICQIFLTIGVEAYRRDGTKYLRRYLPNSKE